MSVTKIDLLTQSQNLKNTNVASDAAIAYSKLNLSDSILNADINSAAGIVDTKLATIATASKVSGSAINTAFAGDGLGISTGVMAVNVDDSSIEISTDTLQVKASGITNAMLAGSIADSKLLTITTASKVSGSAINVAFAGDGLGITTGVMAVNVDDSSIEITTDTLNVKASGITNAMLAGSIADGKLVETYINADGTVPMAANLAMGTNKITGVVDPTADQDAATKAYVDALLSGLSWRPTINLQDSVNTAKPTGAAPSVDSVSVANGDRVLFTALTGGEVGDIDKIFVASGIGTSVVWTLETDGQAGTGAPSQGDAVLITEGAVYANYAVQFDGTDWIQFNGLANVTAGAGLAKSGNIISVNFGAGIKELPSDEVGIELSATSGLELTSALTAGTLQLADSVAGDGLGVSSKVLSVNVDDSSIETSADTLQVKASGITNAMLAGSIADSKLLTISTASKVSGSAINTAFAGNGLGITTGVMAVNVDDSSIEITTDTLNVKASGITNAMLAGSIADSKLLTITTANKVSGSAVQLAATSAIENSTGLRLKSATAGDGLAMTSQVLSVNVDDSTIEITTDTLNVKDGGITNAKMGSDVKIGSLASLTTTTQVSVVAAINELENEIDAIQDLDDLIMNETPTGTINGVNAAFDTANTYVAGQIMIYKNGVLQNPGASNDYVETDSNTATFNAGAIPQTGDVLLVTYQKQ